ncbi:hypothetical protein JD969_05545 [Planctomycetota bacterium]|nr:hypothetical protein JD969_05545 [Planctomycetota bacterium]
MNNKHNKISHTLACITLTMFTFIATGCVTDMNTPKAIKRADFGQVRSNLYDKLPEKRSNRNYLLDRSRVGVITLADGYPESAGFVFEDVYDFLRTQGINDDRTVASAVVLEDIQIWKGDPFEQALTILYYGMQQATIGSWDNARAASQNSLFYLQDFSADPESPPLDTESIAARSLAYEDALARGEDPDEALKSFDGQSLGYTARESNFTLGYLLGGIANQQLGRPEEAADNFNNAIVYNEKVRPIVNQLNTQPYNTVLVVAYGLGPEKIAYGPDRVLAKYTPRTASDTLPLRVSTQNPSFKGSNAPTTLYPVAHDVNRMASEHIWNATENFRLAKSLAGDILIAGGLIAAHIGDNQDDSETIYAGIASVAAGVLTKISARADTRYNDFFPQRYYLVPLYLTDSQTDITLEIKDKPWTRITLRNLTPPDTNQAQFRYVSLVPTRTADNLPPTWAINPPVYTTDFSTDTNTVALPYILGGTDVRTPTDKNIADYPYDLASKLRDFYNAENIKTARQDQRGYSHAHILEGGSSLVSPIPGTTGYNRLFNQTHQPYNPKSQLLKKYLKAQQPTPEQEDNQ